MGNTRNKTLGIISTHIRENWGRPLDELNYETQELLQHGKEIYGEALLLDPSRLFINLPRCASSPDVYHDGMEIPVIHSLIVRGTGGVGDAVIAAVRCLSLRGCDILDPLDRFDGSGPSKLSTSISRFKRGVATTTHFAFSESGSLQLVDHLVEQDALPVIGKPIDGKQGKDIVLLKTRDELVQYVKSHFEARPGVTLFVQKFMEFVSEFRVMTFFGESLGVVLKVRLPGALTANAATGGQFKRSDRPDVEQFVLNKCSREGILGIDVGETADGQLHIIEENRSPQWQAFDVAMECKFAREILVRARKRLQG